MHSYDTQGIFRVRSTEQALWDQPDCEAVKWIWTCWTGVRELTALSYQLSAFSYQLSALSKETGDVRRYHVWQRAHELTLLMYRTLRALPSDERFVLTAQIRRSVRSILTNIPEGCGRTRVSGEDEVRGVEWVGDRSENDGLVSNIVFDGSTPVPHPQS